MMNSKKLILLPLLLVSISVLIANCASSSKNFNTKDVKADEGIFVGNIKVFLNGEDFTKHCYIGFNGNNKPYISLDESGNIIAKTKIGKNTLTYIGCLEVKFISENHVCNWIGAEFLNVGKGKQTYIGNIRVDWNPSGGGGKKALSLFGGAGAGLASGMSDCGTHEVKITNEPSGIKKAYSALDPGHTNFHVSVITSPQ